MRTALLLLVTSACICGPNRHSEGRIVARPAFIHEEPAPELRLDVHKQGDRSLLVVDGVTTAEALEGTLPHAYRWLPTLYLIADTDEPRRLMLWDATRHELHLLGRGQLLPVDAAGDLIFGGSLFAAEPESRSFVLADIDPETHAWRELWHSEQVDPDSVKVTQDAGTLYVGLVRGEGTAVTVGAKPGGSRETVLAAIAPGSAPEVDVIDPRGELRFVPGFQHGSRSLLVTPIEIAGTPSAPSGVFAHAIMYDRATGKQTKLGAIRGCLAERTGHRSPVVSLAWKSAPHPRIGSDCPVNTVDERTGAITREPSQKHDNSSRP